MRIKAANSLKRLKKMKNKRRKSTLFKEEYKSDWHKYSLSSYVGLQEYVKLVSWCNKHVSDKYAREESTFWFKDERDAFKFKLRWGPDNEQE